jgi:hypothetical protein
MRCYIGVASKWLNIRTYSAKRLLAKHIADLGDLERCALRPGNVHSADGWRGVLEPVVSRYRGKGTRLYFRGDAAFANPDIYQFLEVEGMAYAIRLRANMV